MPDGSLSILYSDPLGIYEPAATYALGSNVRFGRLALSNSAELGQADISTIEVEDPGGIRNIVGLRALMVKETAAPSNNQVVFRGVIQDRTYRRDPERALITGADRLIVMDVADYNWQLGARRFVDADANRPAETPGDRIRWLLTSAAHITLFDYGNVTYPTSPTLDANDYRSQTPLDLLADCCIEGQYNFWVDYNEAHGKPELFFMDPDSTAYASDLRVSNANFDHDGATVFAPSEDAELRRSPSRLAFGALVAYGTGRWVYVRNDTVGTQFGKLDQVAPMPNVKSEARARRIGNKFLAKNDEESDRLAFSIKVPAAQVNDIRHGHRLLVKFTHLPGYEDDYHWVRVLKRGVVQEDEGGEDYYRILIEAVPSGDGQGDTEVVYRSAVEAELRVPDNDLGDSGASQRVNWKDTSAPVDATLDLYSEGGYVTGYEFVGAAGTLDFDIYMTDAWAHTGHGDMTTSIDLLRNGAIVGTDSIFYPTTGSFGFESGSYHLTVSGIAAATGDVFTVRHNCVPGPDAITIPSGTGVGEYFKILATSQVTP